MAFSQFLDQKREPLHSLVRALRKEFSYVSVLGTDCRATMFRVDRMNSAVADAQGECGFVAKMTKGGAFFEYSFPDLPADEKGIAALAEKILAAAKVSPALAGKTISAALPKDEAMKKDFARPYDFGDFSDEEILSRCQTINKALLAKDPEHTMNALTIASPYTVSKIFVTENRELSQNYGWVNVYELLIYRDGRPVQVREGTYGTSIREALDGIEKKQDKLLDKARHLAKAQPITPGVYDVITDSSITGLIAHEAFGHGVEMDQFVKDRALGKSYVGKYVASPIANMRDGAGAVLSAASYFFDDDGVLAGNTQIIKDGILVSGISDLTSASELGTVPTGNGRRESFKRKAYSRMTNTFFEAGKDKLEDMIASVKHGYMLFETNNGMEDPKNWQIQCTAEYGIEIVDGKLTENYVSPVVMSGYVPDLLKSISMVSDGFSVIGSGGCGKGYKEWVKVSDGGPCLKVKVKLA